MSYPDFSNAEWTHVVNAFLDGRIDAGGGISVTHFDGGRVIALLYGEDWVFAARLESIPGCVFVTEG
jgi:hypothetical protein